MQFHVYTFREHSRVLWGEGGVKHKETISLKKLNRVKGTHHKKNLKRSLNGHTNFSNNSFFYELVMKM